MNSYFRAVNHRGRNARRTGKARGFCLIVVCAALVLATAGRAAADARGVKLVRLSPPAGDYTLMAPSGWNFWPSGGGPGGVGVEYPVIVSSRAGQPGPFGAIFGLVPVSDILAAAASPPGSGASCGALMRSLQPFGAPIAPDRALSAVSHFIMRNSAGFSVTSMRAISPTQAVATARGPLPAELDAQGRIIWSAPVGEYRINVVTTSVDDPAKQLTADVEGPLCGFMVQPRHFETFAFVELCGAPAHRLDQTLQDCGIIFHTFKPDTQRWQREFLEGYVRERRSEIAQNRFFAGALRDLAARNAEAAERANQEMSKFGQNMMRMQMNTYETMRSAQLQSGEGWMDTLAQSRTFVDPSTGLGYNFTTGGINYRYNCVDALGHYHSSQTLNCTSLGAQLGHGTQLRQLTPVD